MKHNIFIRFLSMFLSLLMAVSVLPFSVWAQNLDEPNDPTEKAEPIIYEEDIPEYSTPVIEDGSRGDNIIDNIPVGEIFYTQEGLALRLNIKGDSYSVVDFINPAATSVTIPETYSALPVNRVADSAFKDMVNLVTVTLHDGIEYIGDDVFGGCTALQFNVLDGVNYLGTATNDYFYAHSAVITDKVNNTSNITNYKAPASTKIIASYAFYNCKELKTVEFHKDIIQVGFRSLRGCDNIEEVTLPFAGEVIDGDTNSHLGFAFGARTYGGNISFVPLTLKKLHVLGGTLQKNALFGLDGITHLTLPRMTAHLGYYYGAETYEENINYIPASLTSVSVQNGDIPDYAFYNCVKITDVELCDGVTSIGWSAFYSCTKLTSVTIGDGVTTIGHNAFYGLKSLSKVIIGISVSYIGAEAFFQCTSLKEVHIKDIENWCKIEFYGIDEYYANPLFYAKGFYVNGELITDLVIPDRVTSISNYAFYNCATLINIRIPDSVTLIGAHAFYGCTNLIGVYSNIESWCKIEFENSYANPLKYAKQLFLDEELVTDLSITDGITYISDWAFAGYLGLTSVEICNSVDSIGHAAFRGCKNLSNVRIADSVTSINSFAFDSCSSLATINYLGPYVQWELIDKGENWNSNIGAYTVYCTDATISQDGGVSYFVDNINNNTELLQLQSENVSISALIDGSLIPTNVINNIYSQGLQYVSNGDGTCYVSGIGDCIDNHIVIPSVSPSGDIVNSIGASAFFNCTSFDSVTIPDSVTSIGASAFSWCTELESITIGNGIMSIGKNAFDRCSNLRKIYISDIVNWCKINFENSSANPLNQQVYSQSFYLNGELITELVIPNEVTSICPYAFDGYTKLTKVIIPDSVNSIGESGFSLCTSLTNISISDNVTSIGAGAFYYTNYYNDDSNWENGVLYIGKHLVAASTTMGDELIVKDGTLCIADYVFSHNTTLLNVILPNSVVSIGDGCFYNCTGLKNINIPNSVILLGLNAFQCCTSLGNIIIPISISYIGPQTFADCTKLTHAIIGAQNIDTNVFYNCSSLSSILFVDNVQSIGASAFSGCSSLEKVTFAEGSKINFIGSNAFAGTNLNKGKETGNKTIYYPGDINEWRFVQKATDWDGDLAITYDQIQCNPITVLYDMKDDKSEFYVSEFVGTEDTEIPEYYAGRPVTLVYDKSFYKVDLGGATVSVTIPESVKTIYSDAFYNSPGIGEIHILSEGFVLSDDVIIEGNPIVNKVLTYNSDPVLDSDFKLPRGMIIGCDSLYEITVPFFGAYYGDTENNYLGYLFGAEKRAENGEYLPKSLKNVTIYLESYIPKYAFAECSYLENIDLSYAYVEEYEENNTKKLQITEKSLVTYIGEYAFSNCLALKEFVIPDSVEAIGEKILENCSAVKTITIGSGIQAIPDLAKENPLFGIEKVTSSLEKYIVAEGNGTYSTDSRGVLYQLHYTLKEPVAVIDAPAKADLTDYVLPTHIVYIAPYAFAYNASLRWIQLDRVRRIDKCAFFGATSLVAAVFGQSNGTGAETGDESALYDEYIKSLAKVESMNEQYYQFIGDQAFMGCTQLRYVNLFSDFIIYIGDEAFCGCSLLEKVHLNKTLEGLGVKVFDDTHLEYIEVANDSQNFKSIDGVLYRRSLNNDGYILEVYPAYKIVNNNAEEKVYQTEFTLPVGENIVAIQSYAFSNTEMLQKVVIAPEKELVIGDYAFNSSNVYVVTIGENVSSIGLVRGEGEYTVFTDCAMLTAINVERDNHYYSSSNGVLFDKLQYKLIKYPAAKPDKEYSLPTSVMTISSMAFKENPNIAIISIRSYINTIGLEAFYGARNLVSIYFNHVYAPLSVMENAFTTQAFVDGTDVDPNTVINYSPGYFENSASGDYGWKNYDGIYNISECVSAPEYIPFDKTNHKAFYAIVVVDSTGMPIGNINVSLTDPHGVEEIIRTGYGESSTIIDNKTSVGTAMFYDLYGTEGVGFVVDYEHAYTLKVTDPNGKYFAYSTDTLMLDGEMCVTYVTLSMQPSVYGVDLSGNDINTETVDLNKAEYGKVQTVVQTEDGLEVVDTDVSETVEIKVVTYYDKTWSIDFANTTALYQNGSVISGCRVIEPTIYEESGDKKSAYIVFEVPVDQLIPEVPIEARVGMLNENGEADASASTFLNIDVIDFTVSADDVKIDSQSLNVNLSGAGEIIMSLIGNDGFSFNIGKNVQVSAVADGKTVTVSLNAGYKKSKSSGKNAVETDCEKGYKNNHDPHNKNTWFFKYPNTKIGKEYYTVNIRFARGTEKDGYLYYQTIVYKGYYAVAANEVDRFWGVVNVRGGRNEAKAKSMLIYYTYVVAATALEKEDKNVEKKDRIYTEPVITFAPSQSTSHNFEVTVYGDIQFQYEKGSGLVPVASTVKGDIKYSFKHNQQFMVWVIPVVLEITVDLEGNLVIKLKFDDSVTVEQARLTLKAEVMAKVGIGCQVLSAGVYGKIGMLFVLDFAPEVGVDKLKLYGGLYAYVTYVTIKFKKILGLPVPVIGSETKDLPIWEGEWYIIGGPDTDEAEVQYYAIPPAALYLADAYGAAESINYIENATLFVSGGKLYKLCFVNMTGEIASEAVGEYDEYNYLKLAVFEWSSESGSWVNPVILDDNGFNDFAYSIVKTNESIAVVFTQQTERTTADSAEDSYDYVSDLAVKYVDLSKLTSPAVFEVFDNEYYKYLPVFNTVNGVPTVVWVENTDNNMFGVSPKNYIDANGDVHIFATAANAIYKSEFVGESWSTPVCVANGLSTVMDLTITDDGRIVYVIDANADMSDASDRVAYSVINGSIVTEKLEAGKNSVMDLHSDGNNVYYYYENENGGGIAYYDFTSSKTEYITVSGEDHISPDYEIIFDENGNVSAVVYSQIKTWEEGYESCDGTAIYGVFKSSEGFGDPVEITTKLIRTVNGVYISEFDAVLDENGNIMLSVEYIDGNGASLDRITDFYAIDSNIYVKESEIDYKNCKITLTFENLGAIAGKVYYSINGGDRIELTEVLSGETIYAEIELDRNDLTPQITFFDGIVGEEIYRMDDIDLHHTDLRPVAKQLLLGSSNVLLVAVRNDGNVAGGGMLYIKVGDHTAEEMFAAEIVKPVRILNPGDILYFEIPLSGDITITDNTIVTLYVASADDSLEKGTTSENNILYTTLKAYQKNVGEFGTSYKPEVLTDKVTYDPMSGSNALPQIYFTCPESCNIETISIDNIVKVKDLDYTVFVNGVVGTIVLSEQTLISLSSGMHILTFTVGGENFSVELEKIRYYKITWIVSATEIKESFVAEGQAPIFVGTPEVSAPEGAIAVFKGWDADGDSKADKFKAVYSDAVYVALWKTEARKYKVSWVMLEEDGIPVIAEEFYRFGDVPEYKGTIFAPTDQAFMTWDKEITAVTGDVVYVATYYDKSTGGMSLNSKEITVFEDSEFEVIITASQIAKINEAVIELSYDVSVATLLGAEIFEGVAIIGAENGLITLKAMVAEGASEMQLIKLKMRAAKNPVKFANELFDIKSNVNLIKNLGNIKIFETGDVNLDGIISAADLSALARHLARIETITDENMIKASDTSLDGRISAADITALARYLAKIISSFENQNA